ncbi:winged helix-turn-helix transcriptional regulator [Clostridium felsineum]|uniref:HTH-type transcriptional activator HxlR n=1 Tax=Clostridium felsineum TaxID=36839 RepID=A0A1S8MCK7_9CLOT|nr:helix-turn-helix domain-containing protein [Clostridium felsineum]URZ04446.1 HTH-type transcriptional activator HxlR [Clostridium felsineum]URZ07345.1 HTH-type transcriptional activator HxlR [Clostridium felsineum]URZ12376.1 HTH-type transcriptional activator HxlR [Clostridium felsineum]URZ17037.1 HTH-type transcriptional activator HxlR [Clostridium felsineum DSM 794]
MSKTFNLDNNCPMDLTINILSGKWKLSILWILSKKITRFNELQRSLPNITQKTLTMQLRELEVAKIIYRKVYAEVPPKVEYGLTSIGENLKPVLNEMCNFGKYYSENLS